MVSPPPSLPLESGRACGRRNWRWRPGSACGQRPGRPGCNGRVSSSPQDPFATAMAARSSSPPPRRGGRPLPPEKGREIFAVLLLVVGLLLGLSFISYHPTDPSWFRTSTLPDPVTRNWILGFGAQAAALAFELVGLACLVLPLLLLSTAIQRWRRPSGQRVVGRGWGGL